MSTGPAVLFVAMVCVIRANGKSRNCGVPDGVGERAQCLIVYAPASIVVAAVLVRQSVGC